VLCTKSPVRFALLFSTGGRSDADEGDDLGVRLPPGLVIASSRRLRPVAVTAACAAERRRKPPSGAVVLRQPAARGAASRALSREAVIGRLLAFALLELLGRRIVRLASCCCRPAGRSSPPAACARFRTTRSAPHRAAARHAGEGGAPSRMSAAGAHQLLVVVRDGVLYEPVGAEASRTC